MITQSETTLKPQETEMHTGNNNLFQILLASIDKLQADSIIWWRKIEMQLSWEYTIEHNYVIKQVFTFHLGLANLLVVSVSLQAP